MSKNYKIIKKSEGYEIVLLIFFSFIQDIGSI